MDTAPAFMKSKLNLLFLASLLSGCKASQQESLPGQYVSTFRQFERYASLKLNADSTFSYKYGFSACQYDIKGTYRVSRGKLILTNAPEYTSAYSKRENLLARDSLTSWFDKDKDSAGYHDLYRFYSGGIFYPALNHMPWRIKKNGIKLVKPEELGCIVEKYRYVKINPREPRQL